MELNTQNQYKVRPVTRYIVTEAVFNGSDVLDSVTEIGEFQNKKLALNTAYAFAHVRDGLVFDIEELEQTAI